jgi:phosphatidylserine/phosphatidylglycerophosphate/cardiolipin synthase-like enzyme
MRRLLATLVTAVCAAGLLSVFIAPTASAAPWAPRDGVIFNNPKGPHASEYAIIRHVNRAIDNAPRGSTISMSMYLFDQASTAWRLYRAHRRGVNVQMLIDDGEGSREIRYLKARLGTSKARRSFVWSCKRSCMSNVAGSVSHSKFFTFSQIGRTRYVSMISSANLHDVNTTVSWNNLHTIANNKRMYDAMRGYFIDMAKDRNNLNYYNTRRPATSGKYAVFFYPRAPKRGVQTVDTLHALNNVSCRTGGGYGSGGRTVVRIAMWGWTNPRMDIAKRVWRLKNAGCKVDVIMNQGRASRSIIKQLIKKTKYGQIPVYNAWRDRNRNDYGELYVHHKAIAINGRVFGKNTKVVYTGSQNFTSTGTRINDDLVLRVTDGATYNAYSRNFSFIAGKYAPRMRTMPKPIVLKSSPNAARRGKFGTGVDPADGLSAAELRILEADVEAKTEANLDR